MVRPGPRKFFPEVACWYNNSSGEGGGGRKSGRVSQRYRPANLKLRFVGISQGRTAVNPPPRRRYRAVQARLSRDGIPKNFQASLPRLPRNSDYEYIAVLFAVFPDENSATIESERIPRRDSNENSGEWNLTWFLLERDVGMQKGRRNFNFPRHRIFRIPRESAGEGRFNQLDGSSLGGEEKSAGGGF